jgi:hypothetical protein
VLYRFQGRTYLTDYRGDTLHFRPDGIRYSDYEKLTDLERMYFTARFKDGSTLEVDSSDVSARPFQYNLEKGVSSRDINSLSLSFLKNGEKYFWYHKNENFISDRGFVNVE